ncbi:acyltransferase family protein [Bariatricus sp. HCP28S3_A7]|uniref:acyltransferase family protein n=1 Tax=Bariatricus sp. HCP28S3_A7 TaxID=3438894 RepID=UPI003F88647A
MDLILLCVVILTFIEVKLDFSGGYLNTYLKREQATAVNGVFVMLVFLRHFKEYIVCEAYDRIFWTVDGYLEQLIVTTFLFYSGYGIMVSLKTKNDYLQKFPKRIFRVWIQFAIAVCLFLFLNLLMGKVYSTSTILLSFTAWQSVGNSNWYILAILVLYAFSYFGGIISRQDSMTTMLFVTAGCCVYVVMLILCGKGSWYYNTIFCYPLGMLFGNYEQKIKTLMEKMGRYLMIVVACVVAFMASYLCALKCHGMIWLAMVELRGIFFVLLVVFATSRIKIGNPVLNWLGKHTFEIYILQRLPMIALSGIDMNQYVYFLICAVVTGLAAFLYQKLMGALLLKCNL